MHTLKTEGIILKRKNIGEADRILTLFSKHFGKIQIRAKGIRKIPSRRSAHVELLNAVTCSFYKGKSIPVLIEVQTQEAFSTIKNDLKKVGFAYYLCELVDGLCPDNQEYEELYYLLYHTLHALTDIPVPRTLVQEFERKLLIALGFYTEIQLSYHPDRTFLIEDLLERRLKTKQLLRHFV